MVALAISADIRDLDHSGLEARHRTAASDMPNRLDERAKIAADIAVRVARLGRTAETEATTLILPAALTGRLLQDLAQKHAAFKERLDAALREKTLAKAETAEALRIQAALASEGSAHTADPAPLADRLRTLRQNDCLLRQQTADRQIATLSDLMDDKLATLSPAQLDADSVAVVSIPDEADIAEWTARRTALTEQLKRLDDKIAEETALTAAEEAKLEELTRTGGFAADDAAFTLRAQRDEAWQAHVAQLDSDSASAFETVLRTD